MAASLPVLTSTEVVRNRDNYFGRMVQIRGHLSHVGDYWELDNLIELKPSYLEMLKIRNIGDEIVVRGYFRKDGSQRGHPYKLDSAFYTQFNDLAQSSTLAPTRKWEK
ncbi:hypothetical protein [Prosthecobacter sp.]|uniref:hypothetical protein n=1 Tax=Prosthecobacter sp. TaxID=1965333 RepID=UPI0037CB9629